MSSYLQIVSICFACSMTIVAYGTIRCKVPGFKDPLAESFVKPPLDKFLDGWGVAHFCFFMTLGFMYPTHWLFITALGVFWEIVEVAFKDHPFYLSKCSYNSDGSKAAWWYGRWQDIVMNTTGLVTGILVRQIS